MWVLEGRAREEKRRVLIVEYGPVQKKNNSLGWPRKDWKISSDYCFLHSFLSFFND